MSAPASPLRHHRQKAGLPPGAVVFVGDAPDAPVRYTLTNFDADSIEEEKTQDVERALAYREAPQTTWIHVSGVHDPASIRDMGEVFGIHPLTQEDIVNTQQRPKVEVFDDEIYIIAKMLRIEDDEVAAEQVSLVVGPNYLLSFQESQQDPFGPVRDRLHKGRTRIRTSGPDYLAYTLLDVMIDHYFVVLEELADRTEAIEDEVLEDPTEETQVRLNSLRRDLLQVRRLTWPVRELLGQLSRLDSPLWTDATDPFVRDVYDHAVQVLDLVESLRDVVSGLTDLYMSALSHRMNEVMQVLTIIGTIFIPLTFIAGIYGMNFEYMPELTVWWAYPLTLALMLIMTLGLVVYFYRRDWL